MTIKTGDNIPQTNFIKATASGPEPVDSGNFFKDRTIILFSLPGAFTPTCSARHLPGYVEKADALLAKGADEIVCTAVNDAFVMQAWSKSGGAEGKITMFADGNGDFVRAIGLTFDASKFGMGTRGQRFSMLVENGVITQLNIEEPGAFNVSSAEYMLDHM